MKILSNAPLSEETIQKIKKIFEESDCPNETLKNTFGDKVFYDGRDTIIFTRFLIKTEV